MASDASHAADKVDAAGVGHVANTDVACRAVRHQGQLAAVDVENAGCFRITRGTGAKANSTGSSLGRDDNVSASHQVAVQVEPIDIENDITGCTYRGKSGAGVHRQGAIVVKLPAATVADAVRNQDAAGSLARQADFDVARGNLPDFRGA